MAGPGLANGVAMAEVAEEERLFLRQHPLLTLAEPGKVGMEPGRAGLRGALRAWGRPRRRPWEGLGPPPRGVREGGPGPRSLRRP